MEATYRLIVERKELTSEHLERNVLIDIYRSQEINDPAGYHLLLVNDGQDLVTMNFAEILEVSRVQKPLLIVAIHCGPDRRYEYGMVVSPDYLGRGSRAAAYEEFILSELLPDIHGSLGVGKFASISIAGFSLGGLSALDLAWRHPSIFRNVGVFSASLWWRARDKNDKDFNQQVDRLMHNQVRTSPTVPALKFFFECGELDETEDRNRNGVIDSIDDTVDLMRELVLKGYREGRDFRYLQMADGRHDVPTWGRAFPHFLHWLDAQL